VETKVRAAAALGIDRSKLYRRLKQYGVMAVRFLQDEEQDGMQLLSNRKPNAMAGVPAAQAAGGGKMTAPVAD
jgi:hypothetical protein